MKNKFKGVIFMLYTEKEFNNLHLVLEQEEIALIEVKELLKGEILSKENQSFEIRRMTLVEAIAKYCKSTIVSHIDFLDDNKEIKVLIISKRKSSSSRIYKRIILSEGKTLDEYFEELIEEKEKIFWESMAEQFVVDQVPLYKEE